MPNAGAAGALQQLFLGYTPTRETTFVNVNSQPWNAYASTSLISDLSWDVSDSWTLTSLTGYRKYEAGVSFDVDSSPVGVTIGTAPSAVPGSASYLPPADADAFINPLTAFPGYFGFIGAPDERIGSFGGRGQTEYWSQELRANFSNDSFDIVAGLFYQAVEQNAQSGSFLAVSNPFTFALAGSICSLDATDYCLLPSNGNNARGRYTINDDTAAAFADVTFHVSDTVSTFLGLRYTSESIDYSYAGAKYVVDDTPGSVVYYELNTALDVANGQFLVPGIPLNINTSREDTDLSGRVGIQWEPTSTQNYYFTYSRAYKGPGLDVDNAASAASVFVEPETGISFEIGTKQRLFDNRLMLNVAVFDQTIEDVQVSTIVPGTIQTALLNAGDLEMLGAEIEGRFSLTDNFSVDGGVTWIDAEHTNTDLTNACFDVNSTAGRCFDANGSPATRELAPIAGSRPQNVSEWRYTVNLNYDQQLQFIPFALSARLGWTWQSEIGPALTGDDPLATPGDIGVLDASVTLASDDDKWDVTVFGKNLTDELAISTMASSSLVSRVYNIYGREYARYGGIQVRARY